MKIGGSFFSSEKHNLAQPLYNSGEKVHPNYCFLCFLLLDHANDRSASPCFQLIRIN